MTTSQNVCLFSYHKSCLIFIKNSVDNVDKSVYKSIFRKFLVLFNVDNRGLNIVPKKQQKTIWKILCTRYTNSLIGKLFI